MPEDAADAAAGAPPAHPSDARERLLEVAERLFAERGYTAVRLRDIAAQVGIRHASLYHHVPGGKEQLFVEVTERLLARHRAGLHASLAVAPPDIRFQLRAVANWLTGQPPLDLVRMAYSDMPRIDPAQAARLSRAAFEALLLPVAEVFQRAAAAGQIRHPDPGLLAGGLVGMLESLHGIPESALAAEGRTRRAIAYVLVDALLDGVRPRDPQASPEPRGLAEPPEPPEPRGPR